MSAQPPGQLPNRLPPTEPHTYLVSLSLSVEVEHEAQITRDGLRRLLAAAILDQLEDVSVQDIARDWLDTWQPEDPQRTARYTSRLVLLEEPAS